MRAETEAATSSRLSAFTGYNKDFGQMHLLMNEFTVSTHICPLNPPCLPASRIVLFDEPCSFLEGHTAVPMRVPSLPRTEGELLSG